MQQSVEDGERHPAGGQEKEKERPCLLYVWGKTHPSLFMDGLSGNVGFVARS